MNITATALCNIRFESNGKLVNIVKGDTFDLAGNVFTYKGMLIDITKYANMFSITRQYGKSTSKLVLRTKCAIQLTSATGSTVVIPAGHTITVVNDIMLVNGAVLDIAKWRNCFESIPAAIEQATEKPVTEEPAKEPVAESATEPTKEEPVAETVAEEPATETVAEEPATETAAEKPATETAAEKPATETAAEKPATETVAEEPATEQGIQSPTDVQYANGILSWTAVANAVGYDIYVNGKNVGRATDTITDLSTILTKSGNYLVGVVATDGSNYSLATDINVAID